MASSFLSGYKMAPSGSSNATDLSDLDYDGEEPVETVLDVEDVDEDNLGNAGEFDTVDHDDDLDPDELEPDQLCGDDIQTEEVEVDDYVVETIDDTVRSLSGVMRNVLSI